MNATRTINVKVHFEDRAEAASCLQDLRRLPGTVVNVVRGRVTPEAADFDLEIQGREKPLKQAVSALSKAAVLPSGLPLE